MKKEELEALADQVMTVLNGKYVRSDICKERRTHMDDTIIDVRKDVTKNENAVTGIYNRIWWLVGIGIVQLCAMSGTLLFFAIKGGAH